MTIKDNYKKNSLHGLIAAVLLALCSVSMAFAENSTPTEVIEGAIKILNEKLTPNKEALAADTDALYSLIDEVLLPRFDRRLAAQLVLAKHWRTASAEQREAFVEIYYANLVQRYADGLLEFDQSKVEILAARDEEKAGRATVRTRVLLDDGKKVPVDYQLAKRKEKGWMIYDVKVEGISYVTNFRAELDAEIKRTSLDAVIDRLKSETSAD